MSAYHQTINQRATGENIRRLRKEISMSADHLADILCVTRSTVFQWEQGKKMPSLTHAVLLADALNVFVEDLVVLTRRKEGEAR